VTVETFFHTTYVLRLPGIARQGLRVGAARSLGAASYDRHASRGVFLSGYDGVSYWYQIAQAFAEHHSDDVLGDGLVPVVLRVSVDADDIEEDDVANLESVHADAFISRDPIDPGDIEIWDGASWIDIEDHDDIDPELGVEWEEDEDVDDGGYWLFPSDPPLLPNDDQLDE
jgi:hypothetical protein